MLIRLFLKRLFGWSVGWSQNHIWNDIFGWSHKCFHQLHWSFWDFIGFFTLFAVINASCVEIKIFCDLVKPHDLSEILLFSFKGSLCENLMQPIQLHTREPHKRAISNCISLQLSQNKCISYKQHMFATLHCFLDKISFESIVKNYCYLIFIAFVEKYLQIGQTSRQPIWVRFFIEPLFSFGLTRYKKN